MQVTAIGAVAASFGDTQVAVFNSSYRVMWMVMIFVGSIAGAMRCNKKKNSSFFQFIFFSIKLNVALGAGQPINAKFITKVGLILVFVTLVKQRRIFVLKNNFSLVVLF